MIKNYLLALAFLALTHLETLPTSNNAYSLLNETSKSNQLPQITLNLEGQKYSTDAIFASHQSLSNMQEQQPLQTTVIVSNKFKTRLSDRATTIVLPLSTPIDVSSLLKTPSTIKGYVLEVDLSYQGQPFGNYDVYVNLPDMEATADTDAYYAGVISFFELPSQQRVIKTLRFDVTDELIEQVTRLRQPSKMQSLTLTFVQKGVTSPEDIFVEKVLLESIEATES